MCFAYDTKLVAMATPLEELEKNGRDQDNSRKYLPFGEKIVKIGPVDTEIALLRVKKNEKITEGKIYSRSASLPSGLKQCKIDTHSFNEMLTGNYLCNDM